MCRPAEEVEVDARRILCNDITLPWESFATRDKLHVIGNEFGAVCAIWGSCDQDVLDEAVDQGFLDAQLISDEDMEQMDSSEAAEVSRAGNEGKPINLDHVWIRVVQFDETKDARLLCAFAEARGAAYESLYDV